MEMFTEHFKLIREIGFLEWIQRYPINPVTIVGAVIIIGFVILIINSKIKKRIAESMRPENASIILLKSIDPSAGGLADNVRVVSANGEDAPWFFFKTLPAIYLRPGENRLELYAEWARGGRIAKFFKTDLQGLTLHIEPNKVYVLEYDIEQGIYLFSEAEHLKVPR